MSADAIQAFDSPSGLARPIAMTDRIELLDIVRGFALYGVLLANLVWVSQEVAVAPAQIAELSTAPIDRAVRYAIQFFVDGKFYTLFTFLFGVGFAVQLVRREARGAAVIPFYLRRLGVLFLIGVAHAYFLWYGDILHHYALFGFFLLGARRHSNRSLLIVGIGVGVAVPAVVAGAKLLLAGAPAGSGTPDAAELTAMHARFQAFTSDAYVAAWRENAMFAMSYWTAGLVLTALPAIVGRFFLGYYAGRRQLLEKPEGHLALFRKLLIWGLVVGLLGNGFWVTTTGLTRSGALAPSSFWVVAAQLPISLGLIAMAAFYLSGIVLLWRLPPWRSRLTCLAPVGRMALTNYLMHSLLYLLLFYSFGLALLGRVGATFCLGLSIAIFAAQMLFSSWWLRRFRFGPAEWLWRSLTYGSRQPMTLRISQPPT